MIKLPGKRQGFEWRIYNRIEEKIERKFTSQENKNSNRKPKTFQKKYTEVHCWCLDEKDELNLLRFEFKPFIYIQLPSQIKVGSQKRTKIGNTWTEEEIEGIVSSFGVDVHEYYFVHLPKFYHYQGNKVYPFLAVSFDSEDEKNKLVNKIRNQQLFSFETKPCRCERECECPCACDDKCVCSTKKCKCEKLCYCPCRCEKKCVCKRKHQAECLLTYHEDHVSQITKMLTMVGYNEGVDESYYQENSTRIKFEKGCASIRKAIEESTDLEAKEELEEQLQEKIKKFNKTSEQTDIMDKQLLSPGLGYAQWFSCKGEEVTATERSVCHSNPEFPIIKEYICDWRTIFPDYSIESKIKISKPLMMGWDIETNSSRIATFPDSSLPKDGIWIISAVFQKALQPDTRESMVFVHGDSNIPKKYTNFKVYRYNTEIEMIFAFLKMVIYKNPILLSGHNIFGYDIKYLSSRLRGFYDKEWPPELSHLKNHDIKVNIVKWKSSAYGYVENHILDLPGRIWIDTMVLVKRDYKFPNYTLDYVAKHFLKTMSKKDMTAKEMFIRKKNLEFFRRKCIERYREIEGPENSWSNKETSKKISSKKIRIVFVNPKKKKNYLTVREFIHKYEPSWEEEYDKILESIDEVIEYGERDSDLIPALLDKMNVWPNLLQQSNVLSVNVVDVFTRGQQVKVLAQIYRSCVRAKKNPKAKEEGIVLDLQPISDYPFIGGYVGKPIPGVKRKVFVLDFASLYPSIIMAYNISPDSFITEKDRKKFKIDNCYIIPCDLTKIDTTQVPEEEFGDEIDEIEDYDEDGKVFRRKVYTKIVGNKDRNTLEVWFVRQPDPGNPTQEGRYKGRLPAVSENLVNERREVRDLIPRYNDSLTKTVLDRLQNALKVAANSGYGILGVRKGGLLSLLEGSIAVTSLGRKWILRVNDLIAGKTGEVHKKVEEELKDKYPDIKNILEGIIIEYNDTDSVFASIPSDDYIKVIDISMSIAKDINGYNSDGKRYFPDEMRLEVEKIFDTLINIGPKMYAGTLMHLKDIPPNPEKNFPGAKKGDVLDNESDWFTRGILTVRRDNCDLTRKLYRLILKCGLENVPYDQTIQLIYNYLERVRKGRVDLEELLETRKISVHYKSNSTYFMKTAKDYLFEKGYLIEGEVRVTYLIVEKPDDAPKDSTGYKIRPLDFYLERKKEGIIEKPDFMYYITNRLLEPCDKLFNIIYNHVLEEFNPIKSYLRNGFKMPKPKELNEIDFTQSFEETQFSLEFTEQTYDDLLGEAKRKSKNEEVKI